MTALVIGAAGQVGSALLRALAAHGVAALGTYHTQARSGLVPLDLTDAAAITSVITAARPDVVYLAAALTAVDYCENHGDEAYRINVEGPQHVARAARAVGATVVYYSTEYVFDGTSGPYAEDDPIAPQSVYARTKAAGEQAVRAATDAHLILRTTVVFGWDPTSKNFAMQVWDRLRAGERMRVPVDQISNPTLASFLADASVQLVARGVRGMTVNVVGRDRVPRTEFAIRLARRLGFDPAAIEPVTTTDLRQVAPRPLNAGLTTDRLTHLLGRPAMPLEDAIDRFARREA